jgi:hypothetical protein
MEVSNEEMIGTLYSFWAMYNSNDERHHKYSNFNFQYGGIVEMAVHYNPLGWVEELSPAGWEKIEQAYNELIELGWG